MDVGIRKKLVFLSSVLLFLICFFIVRLFGIGSTHYKPVIIISDSMEPTIQTGAVVLIKYVELAEVEVDDIVMFYSPQLNGFNTHRVIEKGDDFLRTQGDNTRGPDAGAVIEDSLQGKVVAIWNEAAEYTAPYIEDDGSYNRARAVATFLLLSIWLIIQIFLLMLGGKWLWVLIHVLTGKTHIKDLEHYAEVAANLPNVEIKGNIFRRANLYMTLHIFVREMREIEYIVGKEDRKK